ncbi:hypothetical protein, partial [Myroides odoratus]|uniref:hypothetical protein n=1 Tax=Myroides odoratus TaxID=256 RepID=UPI0033408C92
LIMKLMFKNGQPYLGTFTLIFSPPHRHHTPLTFSSPHHSHRLTFSSPHHKKNNHPISQKTKNSQFLLFLVAIIWYVIK